VRGAYCAASVATMTGLTGGGLFDRTPEWVSRCQTYDGGISAVPGTEAHGGYAFCGLAAIALLGSAESLDLAKLARWTVSDCLALFWGATLTDCSALLWGQTCCISVSAPRTIAGAAKDARFEGDVLLCVLSQCGPCLCVHLCLTRCLCSHVPRPIAGAPTDAV